MISLKSLLTESEFRTRKGSVIGRYKNNVGKRVGNQIYVHRNYATEVIPSQILKRATDILDRTYPGFRYNTVVFDAKNKVVRFDEAPDFDTAREPHVGDYVTVFLGGKRAPVKGHSNNIWHHKWVWVKDDYKGFDVDKSKEWSKLWLSKVDGTAKGSDETWNMQLRNAGLNEASSIAAAKNEPFLLGIILPDGEIKALMAYSSKARHPFGPEWMSGKKWRYYPKSEAVNWWEEPTEKEWRHVKDWLNARSFSVRSINIYTIKENSLTESDDAAVILGTILPDGKVKSVVGRDENARHPAWPGNRWRYVPEINYLTWWEDPSDKERAIVKQYLQNNGYDVIRSAVLTMKPVKYRTTYDDHVAEGVLSEGDRIDFLDQQIARLEAEYDKLEAKGYYTPELAAVQKQLAAFRRERGHWTRLYLAVDKAENRGFATGKRIKEALVMEAQRATPRQLEEFLREQIKGTEWDGKVFAVGGFVRDLLLGKEPKDLDIVIGVNQGGLLFTKWLGQKLGIYKEGSNPVIFPTFGTANLRLDGVTWKGIDFTGEAIDAVMFRKEQYHDPNSRKPTVQFTPDIAEDAKRRDITFNALYLDIASGEILDPTGMGKKDLKDGIVRTAIDPTIIYTDDALRMFRAVRFAAQLGFKLAPEVVEGIKNNLHRLNNTSKERVRDELNKILVSKYPDYGLRLLRDVGLLSHVGPELQQMVGMTQNVHHKDDVFDHTLAVIMGTQPELLRRLIALFHDIGKVVTRAVTPKGVQFIGHEDAGVDIVEKIMMSLKYPRVMIDAVKLGVRHHMKLKHGGDAANITDKTLRKFQIAVGEYLEHLLDVIHADNVAHASASSMPNQIATVRQKLKSLDVQVSKPNLPINGNDLIQLGFKPGPEIGKVLGAITDKWYENPNISRDEALAIARSML